MNYLMKEQNIPLTNSPLSCDEDQQSDIGFHLDVQY